MFDNRSTQSELLDNLSLSNPDLRKNLDEMELMNQWFGSKRLLINALKKIFHKYRDYFIKNKVVIGDLGCGSGDLLRAIALWSKAKNFNTELIGVDANPFIIQYAKEKSNFHNIKYVTEDIFSPEFAQQSFDIVSLNSICHHFSDAALIQLFRNLQKQTRLAIIINDLHRHVLSYYAIKIMAKVFNFTDLAKNDGPLSVLRAFRKQELIRLLHAANIKSYQIDWSWAFRWRIIIWCGTL